MEKINIAFHSISFLLALLAGFLLLIVNQERKHSNRLLAFILIFFAVQNLVFILLFTRLILEVPWLIRLAAPTTFLLAPAAYIYTRSVLNDELTFRKKDWLLLIPALLTLVNFIPFYILPAQEKINYLNENFYGQHQTLDAGRGMIPSQLYYIIRICWSAIFLILSFRMIFRFNVKNVPEVLSRNRIILRWLYVFNILLTSVLLATVFRFISPTINNSQLTPGDILLGGTILLICLHLFVRPQILYGLYQPVSRLMEQNNYITIKEDDPRELTITPSDEDEVATSNTTIFIDPEQQLRYKYRVEQYFRERNSFLHPDFSLDQMVTETKIPRYLLSAFINREYGMGFREYLNRHRVTYFKKNLDRPEWANLTLEAIGKECGFNSRSSFIFNFKKIAGQTPSEYIHSASGKQSD